MGVTVVRRLGELGDGLVLAPERHDPRRAPAASGRTLGALVRVSSEPARAVEGPTLVLDTGHAWEGVVLVSQPPLADVTLRSLKRRLAPGDVVISRLRPYLRQVAWLDETLFALAPGGNAVVASPEFIVLRPAPDGLAAAELPALVPFLLSAAVQAALAAGQEGSHHPRVPLELLLALPVPDAVVASAGAVATEVRARVTDVRRAFRTLRALADHPAVPPPPPVRRGDVFWLDADESRGPRPPYAHPHVVVQDEVFNESRVPTVLVCATTTRLDRATEPGNLLLEAGEGGLPAPSVVLVSRIESVDRRRLGDRLGTLPPDRVDAIVAGLRFQQRLALR